jgi:hypothetical protein
MDQNEYSLNIKNLVEFVGERITDEQIRTILSMQVI